MAGLQVIKHDERDKWDLIVRSFNNYDVYYLAGYSRAFQLHGDGEPILLYYEGGTLRGINVVMKRDIAKDSHFSGNLPENTYYDFTTPYGYGGWLMEGIGDYTLFNEEYSDWCRKNNIISEFVRFHPILNNVKNVSSIYDISILGRTVAVSLDSQSQIWNDLSSKNRNVIRKATKSGVEIYWGRSPERIDEFVPLYNATMDKDDAADYYYFQKDFYNSILSDLKYNSTMFYAVYRGKTIAMSIILFSNQQMHYHLSASDKEYQHLAPTNLLLYEAACWGCENGYRSFHLGGGIGSQEDSLFRFKKAFNKCPQTYFSIGRKIFDQEKYDKLVTLRKNQINSIDETTYFPAYRV